MTTNPDKALLLLKLLSEEYEKTKDPHTAEKIINLVDNEIGSGKYSLEEDYRRKMNNAYGVLLLIPYIKKFALKRNPFKTYWELTAGREEDREKKEVERLWGLYSSDAKAPSQIKAEKEQIEKKVYDALKGSVHELSRSIFMADSMLESVILSEPIVQNFEYQDLLAIAHFLNDAAHKTLWIAQCDVHGNITDNTINPTDECLMSLSNRFTAKQMIDHKIAGSNLSMEDRPLNVKKQFLLEQRNSYFGIVNEALNKIITEFEQNRYEDPYKNFYANGSIANAAAHYACTQDSLDLWPWNPKTNDKNTKTRREQLMEAITLLISEVQHIDTTQKSKS